MGYFYVQLPHILYIDAFQYNNEILSMEITLICQVLKGTKKVAESSNE